MDEPIDVDALFLGPRSENRDFLTTVARFMLDEHIHWRRDYMPEDPAAITGAVKRSNRYQETLDRTESVLLDISSRLKMSSDPWFSPRYLGHMNSDVLMVSTLAYLATVLYNPNNVAYESSVATTKMELEAGSQLAEMLGFDSETAWGHITADGSIANYEALWVARNLKSIPAAVAEVRPDLVAGRDAWQLMNVPMSAALDMVDGLSPQEFDEVRARSTRGRGVVSGSLGKVLVPQTKHYSWTKAMDILGLGQDSLVSVPVTDRFRMDVDRLRDAINECVKAGEPVLAVVSVIGSTEEGAIDEFHRIADLRDEFEAQGVSFHLHIDAAYGGYVRAAILDEFGSVIPGQEINEKLKQQGVVADDIDWPEPEVHQALADMGRADSITVDPHKMGYVPYSAGAIAMRDRRLVTLISYFAAYVFEAEGDNPMLLGSYIMEGSKAGASAAAVYAANQTIPLNICGYGRLVGRGIEGALRLYDHLESLSTFEAGGRTFELRPLVRPDFNIVDWAFNEVGNTSLERMNDLNSRFYSAASYQAGPLYMDDFITSKTELDRESYGDVPAQFVERLGIPRSEWDRIGSVYVLRACVLSPWITAHTGFDEYWPRYTSACIEKLAAVVSELS